MRIAVSIAAIVLLLSACSSNQSTDDGYQAGLEKDPAVVKTVDHVVPKEAPRIPMDGRLRDEHMQMYVSVKIKQEQLRYEQMVSSRAISGVSNQPLISRTWPIDPDALNEKLAMESFEFSPVLYAWAKQLIEKTQKQYADAANSKPERISSFEEAVYAHNLSMIEKFKDELRFAMNYKLDSPPSLVLRQHDNYGFSVPVVFRYKTQCAGNGLSPCQALQRGSGTPQGRPKGWPVSAHGSVAVLAKGDGH